MLLTHAFCVCAEMSSERAALYRQQSLPHRPVIPLVARMADQNTSGTPAMTEREASRLDKFRQLLAGPNTDLGKQLTLSSGCFFFGCSTSWSDCYMVWLCMSMRCQNVNSFKSGSWRYRWWIALFITGAREKQICVQGYLELPNGEIHSVITERKIVIG